MKNPIALFIAVSGLTLHCSTAQLHPELVAAASRVRVVRSASAVAGCTFLAAVSATEEAGYTTSSGLAIDPGTPAITLLQARAHSYGGDTVEVTSSEQSFRAGINNTAGRARTLTTLTGNAYKCASAATAPTTVTASDSGTPSAPPPRWERIDVEGKMGDYKLDGTKTGTPSKEGAALFLVCVQTDPTRQLKAGLLLPEKPQVLDGSVPVEIRLGKERMTTVKMDLGDDERTLGFSEADFPWILTGLISHNRLLVRLTFADDLTEILDFDIRGASEAFGPPLQACRQVQ